MPYQKSARLTLVLCVLAAILYNSWPLGYVLSSQTTRYGFASDLEKVGHPYYWLFILGDILTGACLVTASALMRFKVRAALPSKTWAARSIGLFLFGLFTAAAAFVPVGCSQSCGVGFGRGIGLDGLFSAIAAGGLLTSLISSMILGLRDKLGALLVLTTGAVSVGWSASGVLFVIFALTNRDVHLLQQVFLVLTGADFIMIGLNSDARHNKTI